MLHGVVPEVLEKRELQPAEPTLVGFLATGVGRDMATQVRRFFELLPTEITVVEALVTVLAQVLTQVPE